jgi:hypothetical protein
VKIILASYDGEGIWVYQAFKPSIVEAALRKGTFDRGFGLDRMTWIKPSFGWMLYRSGYASKHRQEAILKIKLAHDGFRQILGQSIETSFNPKIYESQHAWTAALGKSDVRHQWDPDRAITGEKLDRRAIQIGIEGETVKKYVNEWIVKLEEVTDLARAIALAVEQKKRPLPVVPTEVEYAVDEELQRRLGTE